MMMQCNCMWKIYLETRRIGGFLHRDAIMLALAAPFTTGIPIENKYL